MLRVTTTLAHCVFDTRLMYIIMETSQQPSKVGNIMLHYFS